MYDIMYVRMYVDVKYACFVVVVTYIHSQTYVDIYAYVTLSTQICRHSHMFTRGSTHGCVCTCIYTQHTHTHARAHTHTHVHTHSHTHTHTRAHTHTHVHQQSCTHPCLQNPLHIIGTRSRSHCRENDPQCQ